MATSLAAQLSIIAANSENSLNLKAQKAKHSKSLIFEPRVAASQSFDIIYTLCHEGFQELCLLDARFLEFQRDIFSEQSQEEDRTQMTAAQNSELDKRLELFLGLVGGRLRLSPAIKAVEWLVRRFKIHEHNSSFLLLTFLPYHTLPVFTTLLSILPEKIAPDFRFLQPYIRSLTAPPRHTIVQVAINNMPFASALNAYVLRICQARQSYQALLTFWAGIMTEAVAGMLDKSRSGRRGVQLQNEQAVILRLLPTLNEGLSMKKVPDLRIGCYMVLSIMASKGGLEDKILTAMMEAVVLGWTEETTLPGLVCLSILAQHRSAKAISKKLTKELMRVPDLPNLLLELSEHRRVDRLTYGLCMALVERIRKTQEVSSLPLVQQLIGTQLLSDAQIAVNVKALILIAHEMNLSSTTHQDMRSHLASVLVSLSGSSGRLGSVVRGVLGDTDIDIDDLELKLETTLRHLQAPPPPNEDVVMEQSCSAPTHSFSALLQQLPTKTVNEISFLAFILSVSNPADLNSFDDLPILRRQSASENTLYLSFYMRTWCGPYPVMARASALQMASRCVSDDKNSNVDFQAVVPYAVAALGDSATKVRRAAAELLVALSKLYPAGPEAKKKSKPYSCWGDNDLYGTGEGIQDLAWLSTDVASRLLGEIIIPSLEECILDRKHVESVFEKALNSARSSETPKKQEAGRLSQAARTSILTFMAKHVIHTPLAVVKLRLLSSLNQVRSVAGTTRTKFLLPALRQWLDISATEALKRCQEEQVDVAELDSQLLATVAANDKEGVQYLTSIVNGEIASARPALMEATFRRLRAMWSSLKGETQLSTARMLMDVAQLSPDAMDETREAASTGAAELLRTTTLSTDILSLFLDQLSSAAMVADKPPATKRHSKEITAAVRKTTFVLQLIDSSEAGKHPGLLKGLFSVLAELQHLKAQVSSELAYLQGLALGNLLALLKTHKADPSIKLDYGAVRVDLLVDCVQKTSSPQVQNAALLLIASLADAAPEIVLHSVMPIFTFMGSSVLRQNDEYSAHVINQTIREVIPPLISSLRKDKEDPVTGAAELLLSFVAAYEHVPQHRRKPLFSSLVQTLGAEDFLFALLAMLVDKYGVTENIKTFASDLTGSFGVEIQLQSAVKYLELVTDILKPKPSYSKALIGAHEGNASDPQQIALDELTLLPHLLSQKRLVSQTGKLLSQDDMNAARVRDLYSALLESILALADDVKAKKRLHYACGDVLESLLGLLSTSEFVRSVEGLLDRPNEALRRKVLRSLEVRVEQESPSDAVSRTAMLSFLPQLTAIIRQSDDVLYKYTAVGCVDKISEKYGKKDLEAVSAAAETIASSHCLGQSDSRLGVVALLCLSSLIEILREGIVLVLPAAIPMALKYIEANVRADDESQKLYNAGYAFMSALAHYLPYMISGAYLDKLLEISNVSAEANLNDEADESRVQCMQLIAKQVEAKIMFAALERNWEQASTSGALALHEYLEILSMAIDKHPKTVVIKYSPILAKIFQNSFDLRRQWTAAADDRLAIEAIAEIEREVNEVAVKMIYKFNDATFRPIFSHFIEWASSLPKKDRAGRVLRLQSIYGFMSVFFGNLKSIVTNYATYLLENAVDILGTVDPKDNASRELWSRVLRTLTKCFEHDQDDFWQAPSHFSVVAPVLCEQFVNASTMPIIMDLIPAIVELAASADSSDHHKELNGAILKHMRSETASVRLAAVRCQQELTDRLAEEWLEMLPQMLPFISELQEDDDEIVEKETHRWIIKIEGVLGESMDTMLL
ncbi:hypothetical protein QTJ16_001089 [Diplocarpon rosae]|uniref:U3 small nucleolar RNA-associated protein 10 n=1 Tax=Diplocarpon rosae TaxID=946125 RepID=A0AAD9T7I5_9HELO|nr:hypothetical protein QTJ16_001089 [Diplocarpon rosae]